MADTRSDIPARSLFVTTTSLARPSCGRDVALIALTDQILAGRLVVVYAKSGVGKTSLLNAGVAPRLRNADSIPLFLRLNDIEHDIRTSVFEQIRSEAKRQKSGVRCRDLLLWTFFKTAQFWRATFCLHRS